MKNSATQTYSVFLLIGDFITLTAAFSVAYILRVSISHVPISQHVQALTYINIIVTILPFFLLVFALLGLYNARVYQNRFSELWRLLVGAGIGIMGLISYQYIANIQIFPARLVTFYGLLLAFCFLFVFRTIARGIRRLLFRYGVGLSNVLIIGDTRLSTELMRLLANTAVTGYRVVGIVGCHNHKPNGTSVPCFSDFQTALREVKDVQTIVQTELYAQSERNEEVLVYAQEHHLDYRFVPGNGELFTGKIEAELFQSIPVIAVHQTALIGWGRVAKRLMDVILSGIAIIIASPVMLLIAVAIKLTDKGPVFFRQTRLTRNDKKFKVFKFRSNDIRFNGLSPEKAFAKMGKPELAVEYRKNGDFLPNDPRITPIGRFLRHTSLDELPQLFNVFIGDISLVGPRALVPSELAVYKNRHAILSVKSGITGLAQVSGRRNISFDERRQLDVYYVQNWSFWGDLVIMARTVWIVVTGKGAE